VNFRNCSSSIVSVRGSVDDGEGGSFLSGDVGTESPEPPGQDHGAFFDRHACAIAMRCMIVGWFSSSTYS